MDCRLWPVVAAALWSYTATWGISPSNFSLALQLLADAKLLDEEVASAFSARPEVLAEQLRSLQKLHDTTLTLVIDAVEKAWEQLRR